MVAIPTRKGAVLKNLVEKVFLQGLYLRQVGTKIHPGNNVGLGKDYTIFAKIDGVVTYERKGRNKKKVSVYAA